MILTTRLLVILMVLIFCVASTQVVLITVGMFFQMKIIFSSTVLGIDIFLFLFVVCLQIRTITTTNSTTKRAKNPELLQGVNKKITKLCSRVLISCIVFYLPYMIVNCVRNKIHGIVSLKTKFLQDFLLLVSIIIVFLNSLVNALLFLSSNVKARRFLKHPYRTTEKLEYLRKDPLPMAT